jgi:hypothetical protein
MPTQAQADKSTATGYLLLVLGVAGFALGWMFPTQSQTAVGSGAHLGFPVVPDWLPFVMIIGGFLCAVLGGVTIYDRRPLPNEPISAPKPLQLVQDEPWRGPTDLRYLETLKEEVNELEDVLSKSHAEAVEAYEKLPRSSGRIEYGRWRTQKASAEEAIVESQKTLTGLKQRIRKIWNGNVEQELLTLRERLLKLERKKQERQRQLREAETCTRQHTSTDEREQCDRDRADKREELLEEIHEIDEEGIESVHMRRN